MALACSIDRQALQSKATGLGPLRGMPNSASHAVHSSLEGKARVLDTWDTGMDGRNLQGEKWRAHGMMSDLPHNGKPAFTLLMHKVKNLKKDDQALMTG